jgi:hypothetical protein
VPSTYNLTTKFRYISNNTDIITLSWFCDDHWLFDNYSRYLVPYFNWAVTTDNSGSMANCLYSKLRRKLEKVLNWVTLALISKYSELDTGSSEFPSFGFHMVAIKTEFECKS